MSDICHEHLQGDWSGGHEARDLDLGSQESIKPGVLLVGQIPQFTFNQLTLVRKLRAGSIKAHLCQDLQATTFGDLRISK